jgi:ribosomal protein S18 acetylase RimI-like enzyme
MPNSPLTVRTARSSDVPQLVSLLRRSWLVAWAPELPFEAVQAFAAHDPARVHAETMWPSFTIAETSGELVGAIRVVEDVLEDLHVDPNTWGKGIGSQLLEEAERQIGRAHPVARLEVRAFNRRALNFYSRRGWIEAGRYPGTECGAPVENVAMNKIL